MTAYGLELPIVLGVVAKTAYALMPVVAVDAVVAVVVHYCKVSNLQMISAISIITFTA